MEFVHENDDSSDDLYYYRKKPTADYVKGVLTRNGNTVRAQINHINHYYYYTTKYMDGMIQQDNSCRICKEDYCMHSLESSQIPVNKYTANSRNQKKMVRKCDCCCFTHICEDLIPIRGRKIRVRDYMEEDSV